MDHKPENKYEHERIKNNGGRVYRSRSRTKEKRSDPDLLREDSLGPYRVYPGRLSVSRSIGDFKAKNTKDGGNDKVLISTPDVHKFKITKDMNFILLGSDGLFENQQNQSIINHI